jgi:predicted peroxiredoxin
VLLTLALARSTDPDHCTDEEGRMAKLLYIGTAGTDDPTRATFPFLLAKGALDAGHEAGIILMGEAAPLIRDSIAAQVHGVGIPPLTELMEFLVGRDVRITV